MDRERFARGFTATLGARLLHVAASGALILLLTNYLLTQVEYGLLGSALAVFGVARLFSDLGLSKSAARYVTEYRETDPGQIAHVLRAAFGYRLAAIVTVGGALTLLGGRVARLVGEPELAPLLALGGLYVAFHSLTTFTAIAFQGFNRVTWSAVVRAVGSASRVVLVAAFVLSVGGAVGALAGYVASYALAALIGLGVLYAKFYADRDRTTTADRGLSRRVLAYSVPLTATRGANVLDKQVDTLLVTAFGTPVAVANYFLAKQLVDFVETPAASLGFTLSPTYGEQKAADRTERAARVYETAFQHTLLLYVPAAAGMVIVAEPAIRYVFAGKYLGAVPVIRVLSGYVVLQAITFITSDALDFLGRARARAVAKGGTSVANLGLNLVLIPPFGAVGAAAATVVTHAVYVAVNLAVVRAELPISAGRLARHAASVCAVALAMSAAVLLVLPYASNIVWLLAAVLLGVVVWAALAVAIGLLDLRRIRSLLTSDRV